MDISNVLVSVIMSEYHTPEEHLIKSIHSILEQTFNNFEFIIVNDCNSQTLRNIIEDYSDPRIILIENKENIGLAKSLNKAIAISRGKYIVRMDTDDIAHDNRVETLLNFIEDNPTYSVVGSSVNYLTEDGKLIPKIWSGEITKKEFLNRRAPVHPSVIIRKKDLIDVGKYPTEKVRRSEDLVLWAEFLNNNYRIFILENILLDYRVEITDYSKRSLNTRYDEIRNRLKYAKKFKANPIQYLSIFNSVIAGIVPYKLIALYHRKFKK